MTAQNKNSRTIFVLIILTALFVLFSKIVYGQENPVLNYEQVEEISRDKLIFFDYSENSSEFNFEKENLLRTISSIEFSFDDLLYDKKMPNKLKHLIIQTDNVLDIGFFDACIKARVHQYGLQGDPFWAYDGFYGRANGALLLASDFEYALNQSDNFIEFIRFFLAQAAISSVMEHLGYWIYTNSSIPIIKNNDEIGWRGVPYPRDKSGNNNDVPWMKDTPADWSSQLFFGNPPGQIPSEAVFASLPVLYLFSYLITPNKEFVKPNKFTKFKYFIYADGVDYNSKTGLWGGTKLGLRYELPDVLFLDNISTSFYSNSNLNARSRIQIEINPVACSVLLGTNSDGEIGFYGAGITLNKKEGYISINYRKDSQLDWMFSSGWSF